MPLLSIVSRHGMELKAFTLTSKIAMNIFFIMRSMGISLTLLPSTYVTNKYYYYYYYRHFMALCLGLPGWAGTKRNIHPLTSILIINHPLSVSSIYNSTSWLCWHTSSPWKCTALPRSAIGGAMRKNIGWAYLSLLFYLPSLPPLPFSFPYKNYHISWKLKAHFFKGSNYRPC